MGEKTEEKKELPETLYHYCSNDAFLGMIDSEEIWLSDMTMSNDAQEGLLLVQLFSRIASAWKNISPEYEYFDDFFPPRQGLAFCLSASEDQLSQWRGYASDGCGISVGFSFNVLKGMSGALPDAGDTLSTLEEINYISREVINDMTERFDRLADNSDAGIKKDWELMKGMFRLQETGEACIEQSFLSKPDGFHEENEWRLLLMLIKEETSSDDYLAASKGLKYRATQNTVIPYYPLKFGDLKKDLIKTVFVGPKNTTPVEVIQNMLFQKGYGTPEVVRSALSYQ